MHDSTVETAEKTEQEPHLPWLLTGDTRPMVVRSTEAGREPRRRLRGASSSLSALAVLASLTSLGGTASRPDMVASTSSSVLSERQVRPAVQVGDRSAARDLSSSSLATRMVARVCWSLYPWLLQALSNSYTIYA